MAVPLTPPKKWPPIPWWLRVKFECSHCGSMFGLTSDELKIAGGSGLYVAPNCTYCGYSSVYRMPEHKDEYAKDIPDGFVVKAVGGGYKE